MAQQLVLDLPFRAAMGRADFFISEANAAAVAGVDGWEGWSGAKMLLVGPEGSGKTHLAHVFADQSGARIIPADALRGLDPAAAAEASALVVEDADRLAGDSPAEEVLFHLHNAAAGCATPLLLTARTPARRWGLTLPDLQSRMEQAGQLTLAAPDDALLTAVLVKLAADRQLALTPALLAYILPRIDRSLAFAQRFVAELDAEALAAKQRPGTKHARAVLQRLAA